MVDTKNVRRIPGNFFTLSTPLAQFHRYADIQNAIQLFGAHGLFQSDGIMPGSRKAIAHFVQHFGLVSVREDEAEPFPVPPSCRIGEKAFHRITTRSSVRSFQINEQVQVTEGVFAGVPDIHEEIVPAYGIGDVEFEDRFEGAIPHPFGNGHIGLVDGRFSAGPQESCQQYDQQNSVHAAGGLGASGPFGPRGLLRFRLRFGRSPCWPSGRAPPC